MNTDPATKPYLAGFFDADGCVLISRGHGTSYFLLECNVTQVDPTPLLLFKQQYGGNIVGPIQRVGNTRPIYRWAVHSKKAERFLQDVVDHLIVKRERAVLALEFRELFKGVNILPRGREKEKPHNEEKRAKVIALRESAYDDMRVANKRGA